ncbi:unnamed protein product [Leptidea sinapis]|uniref:MICOS complex subunit MIC13 n=1 Tax=Leptidea sinapis TaxID=189913 RepID=A0A5E4QJD6_9NEOP|nr:unnamed protein product [Leptidea sinapis]
MIKFGIKSAVLGSAIYYTVDKGVWKDSATTSELYKELENGASPYVGELRKQIPYEARLLPPLPSNDRISYLFKYYWNSGVKATFKFLVNLPDHTSNVVMKSYNYIANAIEPSEQTTNTSPGDTK